MVDFFKLLLFFHILFPLFRLSSSSSFLCTPQQLVESPVMSFYKYLHKTYLIPLWSQQTFFEIQGGLSSTSSSFECISLHFPASLCQLVSAVHRESMFTNDSHGRFLLTNIHNIIVVRKFVVLHCWHVIVYFNLFSCLC